MAPCGPIGPITQGEVNLNRMTRLAALPLALFALMFVGLAAAKADTIVEIASGNPDFSTLVTAIKAADLVDTLSGDGPFTVFAPTNEAFEKLKAKMGEAKFNAALADKALLTKILTYHVIKGKVMAADVLKLKSGTAVTTVEGGKVVIKHSKSGVFVGKAKVTKTDIEASNGVIHVIDTVLMPTMKKMDHMGKMNHDKMDKMDK